MILWSVWNDINLYTHTRGINRFLGLVLFLEQMESRGHTVPGLTQLKRWTVTSPTLSNQSLQDRISDTSEPIFQKALHWSIEVNQRIKELPSMPLPFEGVEECLTQISRSADIAVVSSANSDALEAEWTHAGLKQYARILMSQSYGTKDFCLKALSEYGYERRRILMVGDSPGDLTAAENAGILFYPILTGHEADSWKRLKMESFPILKAGNYDAAYQKQLIDLFKTNLRKR